MAILLAGGVLLGFLSLVVDVGRIYVEREELQTGADAAALAIAKACATGNPACATPESLLDLAQNYANANSSDGVSKVSGVCGRSTGAVALPACGDPAGNLTDCLGGEPADGPYVEVRVATELPDGSLVLPPLFAQTMAGNGGFDGASVGACARATWQTPADTPVIGLAISTCEWAGLTRGGRIGDDPRDEGVIFTQPGHGTCPGPVTPGWHRAGSASWLASDASCEVLLPLNRVLPEAAGGASTACQNRLRTAALNHETIYLPVYDATRDRFPGEDYRIVAFAPFVPTGFVLGAATTAGGPVLASTLTPPDPPCAVNTAERCVSGVFPEPLVPVSTIAGDALVKLIG